MGRLPKNKFTEVVLAFDQGTKIKVFDIKIPFVYKFTVTPINQAGHTEWEYHVKHPDDISLVAQEIEKQGYKVTKIELSVRKMTDLCPKCHKRGIPKIEIKDANDRRARRPTHLGEIEKNKIQSERLDEYWLTYGHKITDGKTKHKKCRIRQYVNTPDPAYKPNKIPIENYFFPMIIGNMKKGTLQYAD